MDAYHFKVAVLSLDNLKILTIKLSVYKSMNVITKRLKVVIALVLFVLCGGIFLTTSLSASVIAQGEQDEGAVQDQEQDEGEIQDPEQQEQDEESEETEENNEQQELILYVSTGCPHCARVEEFIMNNDLEQEITIRNITVDEGAAEEYSDFVEENQIPMDEQGTPTLIYLDGEDFDLVVGDTPIEDFLSDKYDIKQESNTQGGDYLVLGFGLLFVSFILGYGIVKIINGAEKH
jgi:glutaredoxin